MTDTDLTQAASTEATADMGASPSPRLTTLMLITALAVLPVNMIVPSLPNVATEFGAKFAIVNIAIVGYAVMTALTEIVAGAMSDRYGRRPIVLTSITVFIVASIGCALSTSITMFLLCRVMQASIAACFSIALVIIRETSSQHKAASRFGYLAMGWALAPMIGPLFGGSLDTMFGWRSSFTVLAVLGVAALVLAVCDLKETASRTAMRKGHSLSAYAELLTSARFIALTLCMACSMGTLYVFLGGAPLAATHMLAGSSTALGFYMGMIPAGFMRGSYLAGRYASRLAPGVTLVVARALTCMGLLAGLVLLAFGSSQVLAFFGPCAFIGIGNGLTMPAANAGVLSIRDDLAGTAAGLAAAMTIGGGALVAGLAGPFLAISGTVHGLFVILLMPASLALLAAVFAAVVDRGRVRVDLGE